MVIKNTIKSILFFAPRLLRISTIIFAAASMREAEKCNNGYRWESASKLKLMDGLSKKNNCAGRGKWARAARAGRRAAGVREGEDGGEEGRDPQRG